MIPLLARAFFALADTWTPFVIGFVSALINIIFALLLKDQYGVVGLAIAFSIAMVVQLALLWIALRKRTFTLHELPILHTLYKLSIAALLMGVTIQILKAPIAAVVDMTRFWGIATQGLVAGGSGLLVYSFVSLALRVEEMRELRVSLKRRWLKLTNVPGEVREAEEI